MNSAQTLESIGRTYVRARSLQRHIAELAVTMLLEGKPEAAERLTSVVLPQILVVADRYVASLQERIGDST